MLPSVSRLGAAPLVFRGARILVAAGALAILTALLGPWVGLGIGENFITYDWFRLPRYDLFINGIAVAAVGTLGLIVPGTPSRRRIDRIWQQIPPRRRTTLSSLAFGCLVLALVLAIAPSLLPSAKSTTPSQGSVLDVWPWLSFFVIVAATIGGSALLWLLACRLYRGGRLAPRSFATNSVLVASSCLVGFLILEIATRLLFGIPLTDTTNYTSKHITPNWSRDWAVALKHVYHPVLGWTFPRNESNNPHGLIPRKLDAPSPAQGKTILAVGDSFGTGDVFELNWPSQLEDIIKRPVINGSTGGWGIDQIFLRIQSLVPKVEPDVVIFNFIPDDIRRAELSIFYGSPKPYFDIEGDDLVLQNSPPPRYDPSWRHIGLFRTVFGHSYALLRIATGLGVQDRWMAGLEVRREHRRGAEIGCLIMRKVKDLQVRHGVRRLIVFPQYGSADIWNVSGEAVENGAKMRKILECARAEGLIVADPLPIFEPMGTTPTQQEQTLRAYWRYPNDPHMNAAGDRKMAEFLAPFLD